MKTEPNKHNKTSTSSDSCSQVNETKLQLLERIPHKVNELHFHTQIRWENVRNECIINVNINDNATGKW